MPVIQAACPHDCPDTCAMLITVENGKATAVKGNPEHPPTGGALCTKVSRYLERTYHKDRLLFPLKRVGKKGEGRFVRVTWQSALDDIAQKLNGIRHNNAQRDSGRAYGILPYSYGGTMGAVQSEGMAARFFNAIGASTLDRTICATAGSEALKHTYGGKVGADMEQVNYAAVVVLWGTNSITSNLHFWTRVQDAKRRGAYVIAIDPYRSDTAEKCHEHIALIPGTDAALALGLIHIWCRDDTLDHDYITQYTLGFAGLKARAEQYTPEQVAKICGLNVAQIEGFAAKIAQTALNAPKIAASNLSEDAQRGVFLRLNYGMQRHAGGGNAVRAIACLPSLVGAWRVPSGGLLLSCSSTAPMQADFARDDLLHQVHDEQGANVPLRRVNMSDIGHALNNTGPYSDIDLHPKIEALIVYNSNPVAVAADSSSVARGFAREDLFTVVLEHFQTDTADYADYLLPATTQLEHLDIHRTYGHQYVLMNEAAIAPLGEALPNSEIFRRLAAVMGLEHAALQDSDAQLAEQAFDWAHPNMGGETFASMREKGFIKARLNTAGSVPFVSFAPFAPFSKGGFPTPSGKCEFDSSTLRAMGKDGLPDYVPPLEVKNEILAKKYPLSLISPPARHFLNTTFVNVDSLRKTEGEARVELHPDDAEARQLRDGDCVTVLNDRGRYAAVLRVTERTQRGMAMTPGIWWKKLSVDGKNVNEVTGQHLTDLGAGATFYDCRVEVLAS